MNRVHALQSSSRETVAPRDKSTETTDATDFLDRKIRQDALARNGKGEIMRGSDGLPIYLTGHEFEAKVIKPCPPQLQVGKTGYVEQKKILQDLESATKSTDRIYHPWIREIVTQLTNKLSAKNFTVSFVSASGSSLDVHHGIDGYFLFENQRYEPLRVTIDLTMDVKEQHKADMIVNPIGSPATGIRPDTIAGVAVSVMRILEARMQRAVTRRGAETTLRRY